MTNHELIQILRRVGKFYMPVLSKSEKPVYIAIEKQDLIAHLSGCMPREECAWKIGAKYLDGKKLELRA